jgi:hypothetical protein
MKAILPVEKHQNAKHLDKELIKQYTAIALIEGTMREIIKCKLCTSRNADGASPVYCSLWLLGGEYLSGGGKASGYGYHKTSAAVGQAIRSAGIELLREDGARADINGAGDDAIREALTGITYAMYPEAGQVLIIG